jgi:hypothetical protein
VETALSVLILTVAFIVKTVRRSKQERKKEILDFSIALIEEGIVYAEENFKLLKLEAAQNVHKSIKSGPIEISKDPVAITKSFNTSMEPVRQMTHNAARKYILDSANKIVNKKFRNQILDAITPDIDQAIKMRITAAKMGSVDPLKPLLYRRIV